jgi:hypothetical protein
MAGVLAHGRKRRTVFRSGITSVHVVYPSAGIVAEEHPLHRADPGYATEEPDGSSQAPFLMKSGLIMGKTDDYLIVLPGDGRLFPARDLLIAVVQVYSPARGSPFSPEGPRVPLIGEVVHPPGMRAVFGGDGDFVRGDRASCNTPMPKRGARVDHAGLLVFLPLQLSMAS